MLQTLDKQFQDLLRKHIVFSVLADDELSELLGNCELKSFDLGQTVMEEGDDADSAYLVYSGRVRVFQTVDGKPVTLCSLAPGDLFGEQAILKGGQRSASVRATDDSVLLRIGRDAFDQLLEHHPGLKPYFDQVLDDYALREFLRMTTFVGSLKPKQIMSLLDTIEKCAFSPGERIFAAGDPGDRLYIVRHGEVKISIDQDGEEKILAFINEGDFFGELALIQDQPRSAAATANGDTECLAISRENFNKLRESAGDLQEELTKKIEMYRVNEEMERQYGVRPSDLRERQQLEYGAADGAPDEQSPENLKGRKRGIWRRYPFIRQLDETDCGAASLAMISKYYGIALSIAKLREMANVGREGASLYSLAAAAEKIGYSTRAVRTDYTHLQGLDLPAIAHWRGYHYIVLYEANEKQVTVGDPAVGLIKLSRKEFEEGWTGRLLLLTATPQLLENQPAKTTISRFVPYLKPYHWLLAEIFIASIILELLQLVSPVFTQTIVDRVLVHQNANMLNIMLGGMIIVGFFQAATGMLRQYLAIHVSQKLGMRLSSDLFRQLMKLPMRFFQQRSVGDVLQRFDDNDEIQDVITGKVIATVLDVATIGMTLGLMLYYNVELTMVALAALPFYIAITLGFTPVLKRQNQREFERSAAASSSLIEAVSNIAAIKIGTAENQIRWKHEDHIVQMENVQFEGARIGMLMQGISTTVQLFASTFMLWYGAHLVIKQQLTVGQLMAFQSLVGMAMAPIMGMIGLWEELQQAWLSLNRLSEVYDAELEQNPTTSSIVLPRIRGSVRFDNVSFRYSIDESNILSEVSIDISPGQMCAIVGRSGSGKTTLINLLQRFYTPTEGRILIDGHDITTVDLASLRGQFGVVSQTPAVFSGTIRENICLSEPDASIDRVIAAAKIANAHDFIMAFPRGYDTVIGELGISLSGGQTQRLSIARALLRDPRVIIFDEATSALDTESERMIQRNMNTILHNRTAFVIAHRLSTVKNADKIIVLDQGMVVEEGQHSELLERKGLYYYLNSQQLTM